MIQTVDVFTRRRLHHFVHPTLFRDRIEPKDRKNYWCHCPFLRFKMNILLLSFLQQQLLKNYFTARNKIKILLESQESLLYTFRILNVRGEWKCFVKKISKKEMNRGFLETTRTRCLKYRLSIEAMNECSSLLKQQEPRSSQKELLLFCIYI